MADRVRVVSKLTIGPIGEAVVTVEDAEADTRAVGAREDSGGVVRGGVAQGAEAEGDTKLSCNLFFFFPVHAFFEKNHVSIAASRV